MCHLQLTAKAHSIRCRAFSSPAIKLVFHQRNLPERGEDLHSNPLARLRELRAFSQQIDIKCFEPGYPMSYAWYAKMNHYREVVTVDLSGAQEFDQVLLGHFRCQNKGYHAHHHPQQNTKRKDTVRSTPRHTSRQPFRTL